MEKANAAKRVFPWEKTTYRQFYIDWELLISAAGLEGVVPKDWRSTMGSEMVAAGINLKAATDWLRHSSVATFEKHDANTGAALREMAERRRKWREGADWGCTAERPKMTIGDHA